LTQLEKLQEQLESLDEQANTIDNEINPLTLPKKLTQTEVLSNFETVEKRLASQEQKIDGLTGLVNSLLACQIAHLNSTQARDSHLLAHGSKTTAK
jgi:uncharacterized coiled-coil protein SlyX